MAELKIGSYDPFRHCAAPNCLQVQAAKKEGQELAFGLLTVQSEGRYKGKANPDECWIIQPKSLEYAEFDEEKIRRNLEDGFDFEAIKNEVLDFAKEVIARKGLLCSQCGPYFKWFFTTAGAGRFVCTTLREFFAHIKRKIDAREGAIALGIFVRDGRGES